METPLIKQYFDIKKKYPNSILLFRVGDFYETYGPDAIEEANILNIVLTYKSCGDAGKIEMAGFPHHALDSYLPKLIRAGKRVAICDQLEDPKKTKTLVKRGVTELVTPGVSTNESILPAGENNFLAGLYIDKTQAGVSFLDISTGEFYTAQGTLEYVDKLLGSFAPKEVLYEHGKKALFREHFHYNGACYEMDDWVYTQDAALERLGKQFHTRGVKGFGLQQMPLAVVAAGSVLCYMDLTEHHQLEHIHTLSRIEEDRFVRLDRYTIHSLELCQSINEGGKSLLEILDKTHTPMGARLLRRWLLFPLKDIQEITRRHDVVDYFYKNPEMREFLGRQVARIGDLERIVSKVSVGRVSPREVNALRSSLLAVREIIACADSQSDMEANFQQLMAQLDACDSLCERIGAELVDNPPIAVNRGSVIRDGYNEELDQLRQMSQNGKEYLQRIQEREIAETGINSLKIGFNNVFGYYIEVRSSYRNQVPDSWIRKQTLVNAERYITPELKEYEEKILGAEDRIAELESELFGQLVLDLMAYTARIQRNASAIAQVDCLLSFADVSEQNHYFRPVMTTDDDISICGGRHPVIEKQLPAGEPYIANDVHLSGKDEQILMITGPNMAGKSALIRQTALIVLMAQTGCFVPAESARIGLVDKIFTRVGASDNISLGESTFMVEMTEAADILNNLSERSLVLFDELGRGTSTFDGISIAWAIVEYIHEHPKFKAKTLFATHYHELNEMAKFFPRVRNYHIAVRETGSKVLFLRKLEKGGSEHSFGIHVARMAGMPHSIVRRADEILQQFEGGETSSGEEAAVPALKGSKQLAAQLKQKPVQQVAQNREGYQLSFFQLDDPVLSQVRDELLNIDVNTLTPLEALNKLNDIKKILRGK